MGPRLFLIEGLITLVIGFGCFFLMPASAAQTKTWYRPKGWFTDRELGITVNRVLRDDPTKGDTNSHVLAASKFTDNMVGDMHNRQGITLPRLWESMCDYDLWILYIIGLLVYIPQNPPSAYLTLSLRQLGFSTVSLAFQLTR